MLNLQRCKTTTNRRKLIDTEKMEAKRQLLQQTTTSYSSEHAYRTLLQGPSFVEVTCLRNDFTVPMSRSIFGLYMIPVKIQDTTYRFVIDSGAQISSLKSSLIAKLQLQKLPGTLPIGSVGGKEVPLHGYLLPELSFGALHIAHLPVIELTMRELSICIKDREFSMFDGILGWDILSKLDFELDDVAHQMRILTNCYRFPFPNMVKTAFPLFLVQDEKGNIFTMGFDSGARYSWMSETAMQQYGYIMSEEQTIMGFGVHGMEEMKIRLVNHLSLYLDRANIDLRFVHTGRTNIFPNLAFDGILGNEIFRNRRIRIINSKEMVLLA